MSATFSSMRGFTLIELLVTLTILTLLMFMAVPLATDWLHGSRTLQARGSLIQGFAQAKALALRNPCSAPNATGSHAATLEAQTDGTTVTLSVLAQGDNSCSYLNPGARPNPQWSARLPGGVTLILGGTTLTSGTPLKMNLNNRGTLAASTAFILRQGGNQNDETGTLY